MTGTVVEDFQITSGFNFKKLQSVTSFDTLIVSLFISLACPASFFCLQQEIFKGVPKLGSNIHKYDMFDVQSFYTPASVKETLDGWGNKGIQLFYVIAFIDVFVFCFGYRTLYVIFVNRLFNYLEKVIPKPTMATLRYLVYMPMIVTIADYFEDAAQVAMCLVYQARNGRVGTTNESWVRVVTIASTLNLVKWGTVLLGLGLFVVFVFIAITTSLFGSKKHKK